MPPPTPPKRGHAFKSQIPRRGPIPWDTRPLAKTPFPEADHFSPTIFSLDVDGVIDTLAALTGTTSVPYGSADSSADYVIRPEFVTFLKNAVRKLDKNTLMENFGTISLINSGKLLKGISKRPDAPEMPFELIDAHPYLSAEAKTHHKAQHKVLFEWENKFTVWYLRKRLYAAIVHALIHDFLYGRERRARIEAAMRYKRPFYGFEEMDLQSLQLDHAIPIDGHLKVMHDKKYMQDWKDWAPPTYKWDKDWFKYLTRPVPNIDEDSTRYEVSREVPKGYEQFV